MLHLRLYMSVLRGFNIVPGFVPYTRLQVLAPTFRILCSRPQRLLTPSVHTKVCLLFSGPRPRCDYFRDERLLRPPVRRRETVQPGEMDEGVEQ